MNLHRFIFVAILSMGILNVRASAAQPAPLVITIEYAIESEAYLDGDNGLIARFNAEYAGRYSLTGSNTNSGGRSTQIIEAVRAGDTTGLPTIFQPSVRHWLARVNYETGQPMFDLDATRDTALAWIVIAAYQRYYDALQEHFSGQALGWTQLLDLIGNDDVAEGWSKFGAQYGERFGTLEYAQTNPETSSTGLSALIAQFYALAGAGREFTPEVLAMITAQYQNDVRITRSPQTTTRFRNALRLPNGPDVVHFVPLEENDVFALNCPTDGSPLPPEIVRAIYPADGSFAHSHPMAVGSWVTPQERAAAEAFIDFVLRPENQVYISSFGFRPANTSAAIDARFNAACGVDPAAAPPALTLPDYGVVQAMQRAYTGLPTMNYALVIDTSSSMRGERIEAVEVAAAQLIESINFELSFAFYLYTFDNTIEFELISPDDEARPAAQSRIVRRMERLSDDLDDGTQLFEATRQVLAEVQAYGSDQLWTIIVLTDGLDQSRFVNGNDNLPLPNDLRCALGDPTLEPTSEGELCAPLSSNVRLRFILYGFDELPPQSQEQLANDIGAIAGLTGEIETEQWLRADTNNIGNILLDVADVLAD
jgi:Ca-activated chloride channel family protein